MIQGLIELMLGRVGRAVLAFYAEYSLLINTFVLAYGLVVLWAHSNVRLVVRRMEALMVELARSGPGLDPDGIHAAFSERWAAENAGRRYLFPSRSDLWFSTVQGTRVPEILHITPAYVRMVLHKLLGNPPAGSFAPWDLRAWEEHRHQLLLGIRTHRIDPQTVAARYEKRLRDAAERKRLAGTKRGRK